MGMLGQNCHTCLVFRFRGGSQSGVNRQHVRSERPREKATFKPLLQVDFVTRPNGDSTPVNLLRIF